MTNQSSETSNQEGMSGSHLPEEDSAQTLNIQGYQHLLKGEAGEALSYFQRALSLAPDSPVIFYNMGNALFDLNRPKEAEAAYQQAVAAKPDYPKPYRNLALLYQLRNTDAIAVYRQYLGLAPEDGKSHHNLGLLYMAEGRTVEATNAFKAAAEYLSLDDVESITNLSVGYFCRGDLNGAAKLFEQALVLSPSFIPARYHLGLTYLHQGRCEEAIEVLEAVVAAKAGPPTGGCQSGCGIQHCRAA